MSLSGASLAGNEAEGLDGALLLVLVVAEEVAGGDEARPERVGRYLRARGLEPRRHLPREQQIAELRRQVLIAQYYSSLFCFLNGKNNTKCLFLSLSKPFQAREAKKKAAEDSDFENDSDDDGGGGAAAGGDDDSD